MNDLAAAPAPSFKAQVLVAIARGAVTAIAFELVFFVLLAVVSSYEGFLSTGPVAFGGWDLAFVALLGFAVTPTTLVELVAQRRASTWPRQLLAGVGLALLGAILFAAAWLQVTYLHEISRGGGIHTAISALGTAAGKMLDMWSESRTLLCAYAPAFGLAAWSRLRGWGLRSQIPLTAIGTLLTYYISVQGYAGMPIVRWLAGSGWAHPILGTLVYVLPVPLGVMLPLTAAASEFVHKRGQPHTPDVLTVERESTPSP